MRRKTGHLRAGLRRRVRTDAVRCSTRRRFLIAVASWPLLGSTRAALAQAKQAPVVIGWLSPSSRESSGDGLAALKDGLAALGWKEGSQVVIEARWADGRSERLQRLAEELAAKKPAVIVAGPLAAVAAATKAAPRTPIVISTGGDPVAAGLVKSLARPGGMVTGVTNINTDITEKYLELLLAAAPNVRRVGFLIDSTASLHATFMENARRSVMQRPSVEARFVEVASREEIEPAITRLAKEGVQALIVMPGSIFQVERQRIVKLALARRWPLISISRVWTEDGALLSYGVDPSALNRRAAYFVDRILKGAKPGDLPIEQPTKLELVINGKTAKALGITIPQSLILQADRVIE